MQFTVDRNTGQIAMSGEFTFPDVDPFKQMIMELVQKRGAAITLDLSKLEFIDSSGLGMLLLARGEVQKNECELILAHPVGQVKRMFSLAKFNKLFTVSE